MVGLLHRFALRVFRRLPVRVRRLVVRSLAPSFTVGAMCFIERDDGAVLLVRHSYRDRWGVPGGLLRRGEDVVHGAHREVREEVGVEIEILGEPAVVVDAPPQRIDVIFRCRLAPDVDPDDAQPLSAEITEVAWFGPGELPELQFETAGALVALARAVTAPAGRPLPAAVWPRFDR